MSPIRQTVWENLWTTDFTSSTVVSTLFAIRGLPNSNVTLANLDEMKFRMIAENRFNEVVFGLIGQFWTPDGNLQDFEPEDFESFDEPGFAKCAWSFQLVDQGPFTELVTETRVLCTDPDSRYYFDWYWAFVRPFSGWTRKEILAAVKTESENLN